MALARRAAQGLRRARVPARPASAAAGGAPPGGPPSDEASPPPPGPLPEDRCKMIETPTERGLAANSGELPRRWIDEPLAPSTRSVAVDMPG
jgi:hypothetical protein